jgi:hypothetical protein
MGSLTDYNGLIDAALSEFKSLLLDLHHRSTTRLFVHPETAPSGPGKQTSTVPHRRTLPSLLPASPNHKANHANLEIEMMVILLHRKTHSGAERGAKGRTRRACPRRRPAYVGHLAATVRRARRRASCH